MLRAVGSQVFAALRLSSPPFVARPGPPPAAQEVRSAKLRAWFIIASANIGALCALCALLREREKWPAEAEFVGWRSSAKPGGAKGPPPLLSLAALRAATRVKQAQAPLRSTAKKTPLRSNPLR